MIIDYGPDNWAASPSLIDGIYFVEHALSQRIRRTIRTVFAECFAFTGRVGARFRLSFSKHRKAGQDHTSVWFAPVQLRLRMDKL